MEPCADSADTYQETLDLVEAVRDALLAAAGGGGLAAGLAPEVRLLATREISRLTSRATAAMSIMLLHKALESGQTEGLDGAAAKLPSLQAEVAGQAMTPGAAAAPPSPSLPPAVAALIARGEALFPRVLAVHDAIRPRLLT